MIINKNVINVAKFSFINSLRSKAFIVFNCIILVAMLAFFNFSAVKQILNKNDVHIGTRYKIEVEDTTGMYYKKLEEVKDKYNIESIEKVDKLKEYTLENIEKENLAVKFSYSEDKFNLTITSKEKIDGALYDELISIGSSVKNNILTEKYSITESDSKSFVEDINTSRVIINEESIVEEKYTALTFVMTMIIYFLVIFGTNAVASQVANEKTSKSAEYIFSSIPAKDYLNGKVMGANLKTLISMLLMIFYVVISLAVNSLISKIFAVGAENLNDAGLVNLSGFDFALNSKVIIYIGINFIFILLTSIFLSYVQAGITAKVKNISDMDSTQSITLTIIIIAYFLAFSITSINNIFTKIIANIPIFSMFLMPVNYLNGVTSIYEVLISFAILILAIILIMNIVSRNFKKNILDIRNGSRKDTIDEADDEKYRQQRLIAKNRLSTLGAIISVALLLLIIVQTLFGTLAAFTIGKVSATIYNIIIGLVFVLSMLAGTAVIKLFSEKKATNKEKGKFSLKLFAAGLGAMYLIQMVGEFIVSKFGISTDFVSNAMIYDKTPFGILIFILQIAVLPGIFEELLFRKYIFGELKKFGILFATIMSSLYFGLIHLNLSQGIVAVLIGILFCYIAHKTKSIKTTILLHTVNNLFGALQLICANSLGAIAALNYIYIALAVLGGLVFVISFIKDKNYFKIDIKDSVIKKYKLGLKDLIFNFYSVILIIFIAIFMILTY